MRSIAIIGAGPAGLMAADTILHSSADIRVTIYEKRKAPARKLLIAGSSGLNISNDLPIDAFLSHFESPSPRFAQLFAPMLRSFASRDWIQFVESLGSETFLGTSGRYFVREMKASKLVRAWLKKLDSQGLQWKIGTEILDFDQTADGKIQLQDSMGNTHLHDAVIFSLGGGSYEPPNQSLKWPGIFEKHGVPFTSFRPSNAGYHVAWSEKFLAEADRLPIKSCVLKTPRGEKQGELLVTSYGLEGTPVYTVGTPGLATIDLKPELELSEILKKLRSIKENLAPIRRAKKILNLSPAALALLFHHAPREALLELESFARLIKQFPLVLERPRPLEESISAAGGISIDAVDESLMLSRYPGVFLAGEMLDWDAPTGGFLIQACVSQGRWVGTRVVHYVTSSRG